MKENVRPAVFTQDYILSVLGGEADLPTTLTPYGERLIIEEAFQLVWNMLGRVPEVHAHVFNFLEWLEKLHETNSDIALRMQNYIYTHPNFIVYYMPYIQRHLKQQMQVDSSPVVVFIKRKNPESLRSEDHIQRNKFADKISDDYMREIFDRLAPIPNMDSKTFGLFLDTLCDKAVSFLFKMPSFYKVLHNFIHSVQNEKEYFLADKLVQKLSSPEFLQRMAKSPELASYILGFRNKN